MRLLHYLLLLPFQVKSLQLAVSGDVAFELRLPGTVSDKYVRSQDIVKHNKTHVVVTYVNKKYIAINDTLRSKIRHTKGKHKKKHGTRDKTIVHLLKSGNIKQDSNLKPDTHVSVEYKHDEETSVDEDDSVLSADLGNKHIIDIRSVENDRFLKYKDRYEISKEENVGVDVISSDLNEVLKRKNKEKTSSNQEKVNDSNSTEVEDKVVRGVLDRKVTAAPVEECSYQYPEREQIDVLLSNMMNELTRVFVRAQDLLVDDFRRRQGTRFRVVDKKHTNFFEDVYHNMTAQYLNFYNATADRRSGNDGDPCKHQEEIKELWKDLLDNSLATFRRSALQCIEGNLKLQNRSNDVRLRGKLGQFLVKELGKVKSDQLGSLCDNFQLCYNELL